MSSSFSKNAVICVFADWPSGSTTSATVATVLPVGSMYVARSTASQSSFFTAAVVTLLSPSVQPVQSVLSEMPTRCQAAREGSVDVTRVFTRGARAVEKRVSTGSLRHMLGPAVVAVVRQQVFAG